MARRRVDLPSNPGKLFREPRNMIQPHARTEPKRLAMSDAEFERICQRAAREAIVRNAKLGFPAVSSENGRIVFRSPEQVLAEFAAETKSPIAGQTN